MLSARSGGPASDDVSTSLKEENDDSVNAGDDEALDDFERRNSLHSIEDSSLERASKEDSVIQGITTKINKVLSANPSDDKLMLGITPIDKMNKVQSAHPSPPRKSPPRKRSSAASSGG